MDAAAKVAAATVGGHAGRPTTSGGGRSSSSISQEISEQEGEGVFVELSYDVEYDDGSCGRGMVVLYYW